MKPPELVSGMMTFTQESDSCDNTGIQILQVHIDNAGDGKFLALETTRWAFDNINELTEVLNQARIAFGLEAQ
jgi:hypothetical protein